MEELAGHVREQDVIDIEGTTVTRVRRGGRRWPIVAVLAVIAMVVGVIALVGGDGRDPESALAAAQAFVADADSFRFEYDDEYTSTMGDLEGRGNSVTTERSGGEGAWSAGGWRVTGQSADYEDETILVDGTLYSRSSWDDEDGEGLPDEWVAYPFEEPTRAEQLEMIEQSVEYLDEDFGEEADATMLESELADTAVWIATSVHLGGMSLAGGMGGESLTLDPSGFLDAIAASADPTKVAEEGDVLTLEVVLAAPADAVKAFGRPLPDATLQLELDGDDVPRALRMTVERGTTKAQLEIRFSGWGEPVEVVAPDAEDVDTTPWVDEDAVRAVTGITVYRPTALPAGWQLMDVHSTEEYDELTGCSGLNLSFSPPFDEETFAADDFDYETFEFQYLTLVIVPVSCERDEDDVAGMGIGMMGMDGERREVVLGDTKIWIDSSLEGAELDALAASLQPADLDAMFAELAAINEALMTNG